MRFGSLFSGAGLLDLGFERAGHTCAYHAEVDPYACRVLAKHWPGVPNFGDVRGVDPTALPQVDLLAGGFPCQDISTANVRGRPGLGGEKSGLWREYARIVEGSQPRWVVVENSGQWRSWVPAVRGDLWRLGYASVSLQLCASQFGAPHRRPRAWVVAHADRNGEPLRAVDAEMARLLALPGTFRDWGQPPARDLRVDDGVAHRMDRCRVTGNGVVVDMARMVGLPIDRLEEGRCGA